VLALAGAILISGDGGDGGIIILVHGRNDINIGDAGNRWCERHISVATLLKRVTVVPK